MFVQELLDPYHVVQVVDMARSFAEENRPEMAFDADLVRNHAVTCLRDMERTNVNCFLLLDDNKDAQGFLVGHCSPFYYCQGIEARQELVYIRPAHRTLNNFKKLLKAFEEWAQLNGAIEIVTGVSVYDERRAKRVSNLLTKVGYSRVGYYHMKGVMR